MVTQRSTTVVWVLALSSVITTPALLFIELSGVFLVGIVLAEPSNTLLTQALVLGGLIGVAGLALVLPVIAFFSTTSVAPRAIAGVALASWVGCQLWMIGTALGVCSFEGCFPA